MPFLPSSPGGFGRAATLEAALDDFASDDIAMQVAAFV
jgi:hypothetical protein